MLKEDTIFVPNEASANNILNLWGRELKKLSVNQSSRKSKEYSCKIKEARQSIKDQYQKNDIKSGSKMLLDLKSKLESSYDITLSCISKDLLIEKEKKNDQYPRFFPTPLTSIKHVYIEEKSENIAKEKVGAIFESNLKRGLQAAIEYVSAQRKNNNKRFASDTIKVRQGVEVNVNDENKCVKISGLAPQRGGTKTLYSMRSPSGRPVVIGTRKMSKSDPENYCFYPMVELQYEPENDTQPERWISELPKELQIVIEGVRLIGIHTTIMGTDKPAILREMPITRGTGFIINGSHTSVDLFNIEPKATSRLQFRPRVECILNQDGLFCARSGGQMIDHQTSKNRWEAENQQASNKDVLPKLNLATERDRLGFLPLYDPIYQRETIILKSIIDSQLYNHASCLITEFALIGRYLEEKENNMGFEEACRRAQQDVLEIDLNKNIERALGSPCSPLTYKWA